MKNNRAFTLIELLVVVAVIAILAAIAIPNLLNAQTRSKVSRAKADLRTLATAVEAYTVDHNIPPLDYKVSRGDPMLPPMNADTSGILHPGYAKDGVTLPGLTTPVAYLTNCWIDDPFAGSSSIGTIPFDQQKYTYNWFMQSNRGNPGNSDYIFQEYDQFYGYWRLGSIGPDQTFFNYGTHVIAASRVYDPSNGTVSLGNIWRSQKQPEVTSRPPLDELVDP